MHFYNIANVRAKNNLQTAEYNLLKAAIHIKSNAVVEMGKNMFNYAEKLFYTQGY